jgi:hypothetical protein
VQLVRLRNQPHRRVMRVPVMRSFKGVHQPRQLQGPQRHLPPRLRPFLTFEFIAELWLDVRDVSTNPRTPEVAAGRGAAVRISSVAAAAQTPASNPGENFAALPVQPAMCEPIDGFPTRPSRQISSFFADPLRTPRYLAQILMPSQLVESDVSEAPLDWHVYPSPSGGFTAPYSASNSARVAGSWPKRSIMA